MSKIPRIVILGAGYGGILTALRLQKELNYNEADVTLVNKHDYHYFTTHLHMPAAGTDKPENARVSISKLIDEFKIDLSNRLSCKSAHRIRKSFSRTARFPTIIWSSALGGEPETFGIPGLLEHAMNIRSINSRSSDPRTYRISVCTLQTGAAPHGLFDVCCWRSRLYRYRICWRAGRPAAGAVQAV